MRVPVRGGTVCHVDVLDVLGREHHFAGVVSRDVDWEQAKVVGIGASTCVDLGVAHPLGVDPVVLMRGVPASCFLYRKVVPALAQRGLRGIAFDLPGLGRFATLIEADKFKKPWSMFPFEVPGLDRMWITPMKFRPMFRMLMNMQGVQDRSKVPNDELDAYVDLLFGDDNARAFLKMMKSFEPTPEKSALYQGVASSDRYPKQVVWGDKDPALTYAFHGRIAERLTSTTAERLPAKHFLQEDQYDAVAEAIHRIAS